MLVDAQQISTEKGENEMGQVCENCGWRKNPNNNTGKGCMFSNPKKKKIWHRDGYNKPCNNYVMDTVLREHLKRLLGI